MSYGHGVAVRSIAGALYFTLIGFAVFGVGVLFTWMMWRSYLRAAEMDDWLKVPADILQVEVLTRKASENVSEEYRVQISYRYSIGGRSYDANRFSLRGSRWTQKIDKIEALQELYSAGSAVTAIVKPQDHSFSVLKADTKAPLYSIWFPCVFVFGGIGIMGSGLKSLKNGK